MAFISEADIEQIVLEEFAALGYDTLRGAQIAPDSKTPERKTFSDVVLMERLTAAIDRLNPSIPAEARGDARRKFMSIDKPSLVEENRRSHKFITEGIKVEFYCDDGTIKGDIVKLIDFDDISANDWLAVNQLTVIEGSAKRRCDVVVFVNGLALAVFELKSPANPSATLGDAYKQLQTYKREIPSLFRTNALLVTSDGKDARVGSLTANHERFMPWRTTDGKQIEPKNKVQLPTLIEGIFEQSRLLDLLHNFIVFANSSAGLVKIIAGYHQFHAVQHAVQKTVEASAPQGNRKIGVIWHTQGSGKSLLMAFYAGLLAQRKELKNPTILVITDRNDLDDQLFSTFSMCQDLTRQTPIQAQGRDDLKTKLKDRVSGGVIFTTIQKFSPATNEQAPYPLLSERRNILVIADEAHRSQYGFASRTDKKTGKVAYGFAKYLRDALPKASFIGFTGTPIEKDDINTPAIFGEYIDIYDISRAVEDGVTVPIYYESRLARIATLSEDEKVRIDALVDEITQDEDQSQQERIKKKYSGLEALLGSEQRLAVVAADIVQHFEARVAALHGKAMVVAMNRRICVALYEKIVKLRPDWHSDDDTQGKIKVVMTASASDPQSWQQHTRSKERRDLLAKRVKDSQDMLQIVIVCDMWLTGFDAPPVHTMYIDKPMRGHGLMQAIARVNRVFPNKPAGLVVDYIGIAQKLKNALGQYSGADQKQVGINEAEAVTMLILKYEIVKDMFHGFDYARGLAGTTNERLCALGSAVEWILAKQNKAAAQKKNQDAKRDENRRYQDAVLALSKAFALAAASDKACEIRDDIGFFQAVRALLVKTSVVGDGRNGDDQEFAIQQIIDQAIASTGIVDILAAAGLKTPEISILSDEFLAEIQKFEKKNLAIEALRRLLNDEIRSRSKTNIVESKRFSIRLTEAMTRYHTNATSAAEVLQELIQLAKDVRAAHKRGEEEGISPEEIAFYDALAENESAVDLMGDDRLKVIAHELLGELRGNVTVDWSCKESARARMRIFVKNILRKHGYPPDLQDEAVQTVLQQAEVLSAQLAAALAAENGGAGAKATEGAVGAKSAWLGRQDSNLRMAASKAAALPLGDAPIS